MLTETFVVCAVCSNNWRGIQAVFGANGVPEGLNSFGRSSHVAATYGARLLRRVKPLAGSSVKALDTLAAKLGLCRNSAKGRRLQNTSTTSSAKRMPNPHRGGLQCELTHVEDQNPKPQT